MLPKVSLTLTWATSSNWLDWRCSQSDSSNSPQRLSACLLLSANKGIQAMALLNNDRSYLKTPILPSLVVTNSKRYSMVCPNADSMQIWERATTRFELQILRSTENRHIPLERTVVHEYLYKGRVI